MVKYIAVALLVLLAGCSTKSQEPNIVPAGAVEAKVLVPMCGNAKAIAQKNAEAEDPHLAIQDLTEADGNDFAKVSGAYTSDIIDLMALVRAYKADFKEISLQCDAAANQIKSLNSKQPVVPSTKQ